MNAIDNYFKAEENLCEYLGCGEFIEGEFSDERERFWSVEDDGLYFADSKKEFHGECGNYYEEEITGSIFESKEYTLVKYRDCCGGSDILGIFDNQKRLVK